MGAPRDSYVDRFKYHVVNGQEDTKAKVINCILCCLREKEERP